MLPIHSFQLVLWVHVLAACVWIGGQVTVAAVLPMLRRVGGRAAEVGRRYQLIAWPAFAILVLTGLDNVRNAGIAWSGLATSPTGRTLLAKLGLVAVSGLAAGVHAFLQAPATRRRGATAPVVSALLGSASLLGAVGAALLGVVIAS